MGDWTNDKRVIFVGGTLFSGSTAFHLMLANDPGGFACGEMETLFFPTRKAHVQRLRYCTPEARRLWGRVLRNGFSAAYSTIFETLPKIDFAVDSSKNPFWIREQSKILATKGIAVENVLIWKHPLEFAYSKKRRGSLSGWDRAWVGYHRNYLSLVSEWKAISYRELAIRTDATLTQACDYVGIPYSAGKEEFWTGEAFHLGGNHSARRHFGGVTEGRGDALGEATAGEEITYQKIYYKTIEDVELKEIVEHRLRLCSEMRDILQELEARSNMSSGLRSSAPLETLTRPGWSLLARRVKYGYLKRVGLLMFGKGIWGSLS